MNADDGPLSLRSATAALPDAGWHTPHRRADDFAESVATAMRALPATEIVYTDFDGTLLGPGGSLLTSADRRPSLRAAAALVAAARVGVTVVPVSGRRRRQLWHEARLLGLRDCIAEAGGVIVRGDEVHIEWGATPRGLAPTPHDTLLACGAQDLLLETFAGDLRLYAPWHTGREATTLFHGSIDVAEANALLGQAGLEWCHVIDNGRAGGWPDRHVRAYHLTPRGIGKASAVADDLAARGVTPAAAVAVGDSAEDATMAAEVGAYFRVANGHEHPDMAAIVTPGAMGDGFADAMEALLQRRA